MAHGNFHIEGRIRAKGADVKIRIQDLNLAIRLNITGRDLTFSRRINVYGLYPIGSAAGR